MMQLSPEPHHKLPDSHHIEESASEKVPIYRYRHSQLSSFGAMLIGVLGLVIGVSAFLSYRLVSQVPAELESARLGFSQPKLSTLPVKLFKLYSLFQQFISYYNSYYHSLTLTYYTSQFDPQGTHFPGRGYRTNSRYGTGTGSGGLCPDMRHHSQQKRT